MYKNKIYVLNKINNCQLTKDILKSILSGIDNIDELSDELLKLSFFNQLKLTISSSEDKLTDDNPIKIQLKLNGIVKKDNLQKKILQNIKKDKLIYFSFDLNDDSKFANELKKADSFFVRGQNDTYRIKSRKKLGSGGNGTVFLCLNSKNETFAIKIFRNPNEKRKDAFIYEANFLYKNTNNNIVKVYDIQVSNGEVLFYIMEKFHKTLEEFLELDIENKKYIPKIKRNDYFLVVNTLLDVVKELENQDLYHTDIKLENILVKIDCKNRLHKIVLADFGCLGPKIRNHDDVIGNIEFKAPEAFNIGKIDVGKHDIYSLAMIFNKIITGQRPVGENYKQIGMIDGWKDLVFVDYIISIMLEQNTLQRPSISISTKLFNFIQDLLIFDNKLFNKINKIKGEKKLRTYLNFPLYKYGTFIRGNKKFKNEKVGFNFESFKVNNEENILHIIKGVDGTNYKKNSAKIMDNPFIIDAFYDNDLKNIELYHMNSYIMILKKYQRTQSISFYNKNNIENHYDFLNQSETHDNEIFFDPRGLNGMKSSSKFIVFNSKYLPFNKRIRFILAYTAPLSQKPSKHLNGLGITDTIHYPSFLRLFFLFNDIIFPIKINKDTENYIKNEFILK